MWCLFHQFTCIIKKMLHFLLRIWFVEYGLQSALLIIVKRKEEEKTRPTVNCKIRCLTTNNLIGSVSSSQNIFLSLLASKLHNNAESSVELVETANLRTQSPKMQCSYTIELCNKQVLKADLFAQNACLRRWES